MCAISFITFYCMLLIMSSTCSLVFFFISYLKRMALISIEIEYDTLHFILYFYFFFFDKNRYYAPLCFVRRIAKSRKDNNKKFERERERKTNLSLSLFFRLFESVQNRSSVVYILLR